MLNHYYDINKKEDYEKIYNLGLSFSNPTRIAILAQLKEGWRSVSELATLNYVSVSSILFHLNILKKADLVNVAVVKGKNCDKTMVSRSCATININFVTDELDKSKIKHYVQSQIVGGYINASFGPKSGIVTGKNTPNLYLDSPFMSDRFDALLIYTNRGLVEYGFDNSAFKDKKILSITFSLEICSETSYYDNNYKSDITFSINGVDILAYTCPGDFGGRKGIYTPSFWSVDSTQYGILKTIKVDNFGIYLDGVFLSNSITISSLNLSESNIIKFKIYNKEDCTYPGGFNIFSKDFGDYKQDIIMDVEYE